MLQKFAMVKYGVFVAKICKHALCASTVRDIWWSPLARQLLPPCQEEILEKEVPLGSSPETDLGNDFYWSFCRLVDMTLAHELSSVLRQRRIG